MNNRAAAYIAEHAEWFELDGGRELMLPLDKIQGFLDLLQPSDVPPEKLQTLYKWQAEAVRELKRQLEQQGQNTDDRSETDEDDER